MRYFYSKLGTGNSLAKELLEGHSPFGRAAVAVFFETKTGNREEALADSSGREQVRKFFECGDRQYESSIVVLHDQKLTVVSPTGGVEVVRCEREFGFAQSGEFVKFLPVERVLDKDVKDIPMVLATLPANRYYSSGSFREIGDLGVVRALEFVLGRQVVPFETPEQIVLCLGSTEIETLIAKLFEESGCFVPAYRGGVLKGIDLLPRNDSALPISIAGIRIAPGQTASVQIKRSGTFEQNTSECEHLIVAQRDAAKILEAVRSSTETKRWLVSSMWWLPRKEIEKWIL